MLTIERRVKAAFRPGLGTGLPGSVPALRRSARCGTSSTPSPSLAAGGAWRAATRAARPVPRPGSRSPRWVTCSGACGGPSTRPGLLLRTSARRAQRRQSPTGLAGGGARPTPRSRRPALPTAAARRSRVARDAAPCAAPPARATREIAQAGSARIERPIFREPWASPRSRSVRSAYIAISTTAPEHCPFIHRA